MGGRNKLRMTTLWERQSSQGEKSDDNSGI